MIRTGQDGVEVSKSVKPSVLQSRPPSRVPLPSSTRQPSATQQALKPAPDRQSKSWGSTTSSSSYSRSHTQTESGSSSSGRSFDGSPRNDSPSFSSASSRQLSRGTTDSALGIQYDKEVTDSPHQVEEQTDAAKLEVPITVIYPELDRYRTHEQILNVPYRLATQDLPPPTPGSLFFSANSSQLSAFSASPSTKFSESPGPGSYSRDTTPTSISSQSPGLVAPSRGFPLGKSRLHSPSFSRPPVTRRRTGSISNEVDAISVDPHGLAAVRESLTSSSSNSTVREGDRGAKKAIKPETVLAPPPPSPPPRKSSQKFSISKDEGEPSPQLRRQTQRLAKREISSPPKPSTQTRPQQALSPKPTRPSRPTRDGTPDLYPQLRSPVPIIQSNLISRPPRTERRGSESAVTKPPSGPPQFIQTKSASTSHLPTGKDVALLEPVELRKPNLINSPLRSGSPGPNTGSSPGTRFPFFGRRRKTPENTQVDQKEKSVRKGPAAGTGHEGYGRIGAVRRRSGSLMNATRTTAGSQMSSEQSLTNDSFLADRMNPVIIAGGEVIENRNTSSELTRIESDQNLPHGRSSTDSKANSVMSSSSRNVSRTTLWPSALPRGLDPTPASRRPSGGSDSSTKPTIAFRRSIQRLKSSPDNPLRLPQPINTIGITPSPMTSLDTGILSDESSMFELRSQLSNEPSTLGSPPKKLKKPRSPRKWNFFGRSKTKPAPEIKNEKVAVTVLPVEEKQVPYYAIIDSPEQGQAEPMNVQVALRQAEVYTQSQAKHSAPELRLPDSQAPEIPLPAIIVPADLYQPQPEVEPEVTPELHISQVNTSVPLRLNLNTRRPSRLAQVGRIPQVVSNRPVMAAATRSFSRPFGTDLQPLSRETQTYNLLTSTNDHMPFGLSTPVPAASVDGSIFTEFSCNESIHQRSPEVPVLKEFIAFSPRKNSDCTSCSCSTDSARYSYADATAIIPKPHDPPVEDEVWDEYDDLLGDENLKVPQSATSSKGIPFHLEAYETQLPKKPLESPTMLVDSRKASMLSEAPTTSTTFSADMTERIRTAFQPKPSPTTSTPVLNDTKQTTPETRLSTSSSHKARQSGSSSSSEEWSPPAQVNLRVGSMTVSKWLTFGHVLFSDIRHELIRDVDALKRPSILVIDGLGNDDWSFYAAETYPGANFFNLSPRAPLPADLQSTGSGYPLSPPNHHQIQYLSHLDKFPFAPQSFTCVVYRFPVAAAESYYRNILAEARRVLKPGGYIEMSILDVDLNNMGHRGRKAVRQLKERIHEKSSETNLASTADLMVRLLGRGGFSTIKAARVGVPVASNIARSSTDSSSNRNSVEKKKKKVGEQPSLAEMMRDHSPTADEGITSMVARVGRWWYSRCYENANSSSTGKTTWNDKALLRECEELGTSFKLMVCCARSPERINSM
ncbi:hypothetical protein PT974_04322 [Cladobotryum mycophilum]|uniref:Methyltransferase type 11 domain-containing protein n=1 Tax=Cladobotryum mycophilum TaxID=491253 RepID=A0ABR0SUT6_9HYPO